MTVFRTDTKEAHMTKKEEKDQLENKSQGKKKKNKKKPQSYLIPSPL